MSNIRSNQKIMMRPFLLLTTVALLLFVLQGTCLATPSEDWALKDLNGKSLKLGDFHGKWVLVNFWATWCPPCLSEIPDLVKLSQERKDKDVIVIGIALSYRSSKDVIEFIRKQSIPYSMVLGNEDIAGEFGGLVGLPTSMLYSPAGKYIGSHDGPLNSDDLMNAFQTEKINGIFTIH